MRGKTVVAGFILGLSAMAASAQNANPPYPNNVYCSGIVSSEDIPRDDYVISGQESNYKLVFEENDYVFISKGASQGVKVGDQFTVIRPVVDSTETQWTRWQFAMLHKMGTVWEDEGRLRVIEARPDVSIAHVEHACEYLQRGDIVLPLVERPEPPLKPSVKADPFTPANGKAMAMVITGKKFIPGVGKNDFVYVNLGGAQGVKIGDYFRIFRYTGTQNEVAYQTPRYAFDVEGYLGPTYGYGAAAKKWNWNNVPREVLGEGIVVRTAPNSSTVLVTFSSREIYAGDYVELE